MIILKNKLIKNFIYNLAIANKSFFYLLKPLIPRNIQLYIRSIFVQYIKNQDSIHWPIDKTSAKSHDPFPGWPDNKSFALILTHDVETYRGKDRCRYIVEMEQRLGFRSSINFVPEGYEVERDLRELLTDKGFEVGVHGLNHDGKLYKNHTVFQRRAEKINGYLNEWDAVGFRSPAMHHNLEWIHELEIKYDTSTFDTDPFEPQPDGVGTIFPFWVQGGADKKGYVELPYTLPQDFTLFVIMKEKNIEIWKRKLDWIAEQGGMALVITHPDYMHFGDGKPGIEEYPAGLYEDFLEYIREMYDGQYWHVLPKEMAHFWASDVVKKK